MFEGGEAPAAQTEDIANVVTAMSDFYVEGGDMHTKIQGLLAEHGSKFENDFTIGNEHKLE